MDLDPLTPLLESPRIFRLYTLTRILPAVINQQPPTTRER